MVSQNLEPVSIGATVNWAVVGTVLRMKQVMNIKHITQCSVTEVMGVVHSALFQYLDSL